MPQISVIGLGVNESAKLSDEALVALKDADLVIGSKRQLGTLSCILTTQKTAILPKLMALKKLMETVNKVVVLGSGDALYYGIGRWINEHVDAPQIQFFPAISSITQACHCLGFSQQDINVLSLHGRPVDKLKTLLKAQHTLLVLTDKHSQPQHLASICMQTGFTQAEIIVCERLGYQTQKISRFTAAHLQQHPQDFDALHVSFIICHQNNGYLPAFPGIKDRHFETGELGSKGLISKRQVRLAILSLLQLEKDDVLWDIGAGCGAVSVELAFWQPQAHIHAIEHHQQRFDCLVKNQHKFGVLSNLKACFGRAPEILATLPSANKIFIGGSDGELPTLLTMLWASLPEGGQIVVSAVIESSKSQLLDFYMLRTNSADAEIETHQVAINTGSTLAGQLIYRPALAVSLFSFIKRKQS